MRAKAGRLLDRPLVHVLLIAAMGLLVYSNTFNVPFVFDDLPNIEVNPAIKDFKYFRDPSEVDKLGIGKVGHTFKTRYVGFLTLALNYKLGGLDVRGYHVFNLTVHITNALLVYWLVRLTLRTPFFARRGLQADNAAALLASLLFVSHPVQTQAVTYIVQRFASLVATFYMLSLVFYIKWRLAAAQQRSSPTEQKARKKLLLYSASALPLYCASLLSAVLAMKTKENAFTLPFMATVYELMFFEGSMRKRALYLAPMALTLLIIPLSLADMAEHGGVGGALDAISSSETVSRSASEYLFTEFRVVATYIRLLFLPINQNLDYGYPIYKFFLAPQVSLSFVLLLSVIGLAFYFHSRSKVGNPRLRVASFGISWFFIALSMESGAVPIADVIFEHRAYLPSAGAFMALAVAMSMAVERYARIRKSLVASLAAMVVLLSSATYARNRMWGTDVGLWEDVIKKSPKKARGYYNLCEVYIYKGAPDDAIKHCLTALALNPSDVIAYNAHYNLGFAYSDKGMLDDAIKNFARAAVLDPANAKAHFSLGFAYLRKGLMEKALVEFEAALRIDPGMAQARMFLDYIDRQTHSQIRR